MIAFAQLRSTVRRAARRFRADEGGATAVEYGLIVALISVAMMATVFAIGADIKTALYGKIVAALSAM